MPIYEYRCENGHTFEVVQRMSDDPVSSCEECGAQVQRVFHPVAVHFKGKGFYNTDYGKQKRGAESDGEAKGSDSKDSDTKSSDPAAGKDAKGSGSKDGGSASKPSDSKGSDEKGSKPAKASTSAD